MVLGGCAESLESRQRTKIVTTELPSLGYHTHPVTISYGLGRALAYLVNLPHSGSG